jgi:copper chaperone CopZ
MIRRRFLGLITLAGASGATALTKAAQSRSDVKTTTFRVTGFTCITCATGLETLLGREAGVLAVKASYPEGIASVRYDARSTSDDQIQRTIEAMGFHAHTLGAA